MTDGEKRGVTKKRKPGKMRRGLAVIALATLMAVLCSCGTPPQTPLESEAVASESVPAVSLPDLTQPEGGKLDLAYLTGQTEEPVQVQPGTAMSEEEIVQLARQLLERGGAWNSWKNKAENWALDQTATKTKTIDDGQEIPVYPLLDFANEQQMRQIMQTIFSKEYVQSEWERLFEKNWGPFCVDEQGGLLADPAYGGRVEFWYLPDQMKLLGAMEDKIYLEIPGQVNAGPEEAYRLLLVREQGRWVLGGWEADMQWDNDYIALPPELEQIADQSDEATRLAVHIAWRLGESLEQLDQQAVNRCFSMREEPVYDWEGEYPLKDISGLQLKGFDVQVADEGQVYLELDVQQAGGTPFEEGKHRYPIWVYNSDDSYYPKGCIRMMRPESPLDTDGAQGVSEADAEQLMNLVNTVRNWYSTQAFENCTENIGPNTLSYLLIRMEQEGVIGPDGANLEQLQWAAQAYLGIEDYQPSTQAVEAVCYEENGRYTHREVCGVSVGPEGPQWFSEISNEQNEYSAEICFAEDAVGLVPGERLRYVFEKTDDGIFRLKRCVKTDA